MSRLHYIVLLLFSQVTLWAASPVWMDSEKREKIYSSSVYYSGFAIVDRTSNEAIEHTIERAKQNARAELMTRIYVRVERVTTDSLRNVWEAGSAHTSDVMMVLTTLRGAQADIPDVQVEVYVDEMQKYVATFAYVRINGLATKLQRQLMMQLSRVEVRQEEAEQYLAEGMRQKSRASVAMFKKLLADIDEIRLTMIAIDETLTDEELMTVDWRSAHLRTVAIESALNRSVKVYVSCISDNKKGEDISLQAMVQGELSRSGCVLVDKGEAEWTIIAHYASEPYNQHTEGYYTFYFTRDVGTLKIYNQNHDLAFVEQIVVKGAHTLGYQEASLDGLRQLAIELSKLIINQIQQ